MSYITIVEMCVSKDQSPTLGSNRVSLIIQGSKPTSRCRFRGRPFRFEAMWLRDGGCEDVIKQAWTSSKTGMQNHQVETKLKSYADSLKA